MDLGDGIFFLLTIICAMNMAKVEAQDIPDLDKFGDLLGDLLGDTEDLFDFTGAGTDDPAVQPGSEVGGLSCYECYSNGGDHPCAEPTEETVEVKLCGQDISGTTNHCGWMKVTISTPVVGKPGESMVVDWFYRGCVPIPAHREYGGKCYKDADLDATVKDLMGKTVKEIVDGSHNSTIAGQGCFCTEDLCNHESSSASTIVLSTLVTLISAVAVCSPWVVD